MVKPLMTTRAFRALFCTAFFAWHLMPSASTAAPVDEIKLLVEKNQPADAYALGKSLPDELGSPAFDLYFGVAAIDSGHAGEGVLALERYIANFPDNHSARLELARGYFVLGDDVRAREEFDNVLKTAPPAAVRSTIERFYDAMRARESRYRTSTGFYLETGMGRDSNVNSGVASANVNLPLFGPVTLQSGIRAGDVFTHLATGGHFTKPLTPGISLFGSLNTETKFNQTQTVFDQGNLAAAAGASLLQEKNLWRATFSFGDLWVHNDRYRTTKGIAGEVSHQLDEIQMFSASLQYAEMSHPGANAVRDGYFSGGGIGYRRALLTDIQPLLTLALNYGREHNTQNRPDFGRTVTGARAAVAITPAPRWSAAAGLSFQVNDYAGADAVFGAVRKDFYRGADFSAGYAIDRNLSLRGEYQYSYNTSNIALYEYDRHLLLLKLRYEFK